MQKIYDQDAFEKERRPSLLTFPTRKEDLVAESISKDGSVYGYIRISREGMKTYSIHGTFDFNEQKLITTRSAIFPTTDDKLITSIGIFEFLCSPAD